MSLYKIKKSGFSVTLVPSRYVTDELLSKLEAVESLDELEHLAGSYTGQTSSAFFKDGVVKIGHVFNTDADCLFAGLYLRRSGDKIRIELIHKTQHDTDSVDERNGI